MSFKLSVRKSCNLARCPHNSHVTVLSCTSIFICKTHFSSKGHPVPAHFWTSLAKPDVMSITARIVGREEENSCLLQGKKSANWRALGLHMQFDGDCSASGQVCNVPPQGYWVAGKISLWTAVQRHIGAQCDNREDGILSKKLSLPVEDMPSVETGEAPTSSKMAPSTSSGHNLLTRGMKGSWDSNDFLVFPGHVHRDWAKEIH